MTIKRTLHLHYPDSYALHITSILFSNTIYSAEFLHNYSLAIKQVNIEVNQ